MANLWWLKVPGSTTVGRSKKLPWSPCPSLKALARIWVNDTQELYHHMGMSAQYLFVFGQGQLGGVFKELIIVLQVCNKRGQRQIIVLAIFEPISIFLGSF